MDLKFIMEKEDFQVYRSEQKGVFYYYLNYKTKTETQLIIATKFKPTNEQQLIKLLLKDAQLILLEKLIKKEMEEEYELPFKRKE